jgi:hypothetical protein
LEKREMAKQPVKTELTREEMEAVIRGGGSVCIGGGEVISRIADLPDDEDSIAAAEQELADRKARAGVSKTKDESDLPEGFPARAKLIAGGFDSVEKVNDAPDEELLKVSGVGASTVAQIREELG